MSTSEGAGVEGVGREGAGIGEGAVAECRGVDRGSSCNTGDGAVATAAGRCGDSDEAAYDGGLVCAGGTGSVNFQKPVVLQGNTRQGTHHARDGQRGFDAVFDGHWGACFEAFGDTSG